MAYPKKGGNFNNSSSFQNREKATDKWKNWEYGTLKVTVTPGKPTLKDKEPSSIVNLYNLDTQDAQDIVNRLTTLPNKVSVGAWVDKTEPTHIFIKVYSKDVDAWLDGGDLNSIQSVLYKSGKYDNNEIAQLEDQIGSGLESLNSEGAKKLGDEAESTAMEMWSKYLSTVNDKATMDKLMLYRRLYKKYGVYGIMLSIRNVDLIRTKMPDATFVTTKGTWEKEFGRGIKRGATPLPYCVFIPNDKNTASEFDAAKQQTNWDTTNNSDLGSQVTRGIDKIASEGKNGYFKISIGYDVRDTYLFSGAKEDKFTSQEGLLNNLTGELNQKAKDREASLLSNDGNQQTIDGQDEMEKRTQMAVDFMSQNAQEMGITPKTNGDPNNNLADMIFEYCKNAAARKAGILNPTNANIYAENATKVTLILTKLATPALQKFSQTYVYDKKEAAGLMSVVYGLVTRLEKNTVLNEGVLSWLKDKASFISAFLKALKEIGCKVVESKNTQTPEMVKEGFYKIFDKINADLF